LIHTKEGTNPILITRASDGCSKNVMDWGLV